MGQRDGGFNATFHRKLFGTVGLHLNIDVGVKDLVVRVKDLAGGGISDEAPLGIISGSGIGAGHQEVNGAARLFGDAIHARKDDGSNAGDFSLCELADRNTRKSGGVEVAGNKPTRNREILDLGNLRRDQDGWESRLIANQYADRGVEDGGAVDVWDETNEHELCVASHRIGHEGKDMVRTTPRADRKKLLGRDAPEALGVLCNEAASTVAGIRTLRKRGAEDSFDSTIDQRSPRTGVLALECHPTGVRIVGSRRTNVNAPGRGIRSWIVQWASFCHRNGAEAGNCQKSGDDRGVLEQHQYWFQIFEGREFGVIRFGANPAVEELDCCPIETLEQVQSSRNIVFIALTHLDFTSVSPIFGPSVALCLPSRPSTLVGSDGQRTQKNLESRRRGDRKSTRQA